MEEKQTEAQRLADKLKLKKAKIEWNSQNSYSKRSHPWQLFLRLTSDDLFAGKEACQAWSNRILDY